MEYDIAEIRETRDIDKFLNMMQETFEAAIGGQRFFRLTATPAALGEISADLDSPSLRRLLEEPPSPNSRLAGWDVKPLPPLKRNALGFENERIDFHHLKFIKNGHLEFWTAIDESFCWQQPEEQFLKHPRLYPYAVVEHPLSFTRLYRALADLLRIECDVLFQMQYLNVKSVILLPFAPESVGFMSPMQPIKPLERERLLFERKRFPHDFDADPCALELIKDLYYEFGYGREHIPFFDATGHSRL